MKRQASHNPIPAHRAAYGRPVTTVTGPASREGSWLRSGITGIVLVFLWLALAPVAAVPAHAQQGDEVDWSGGTIVVWGNGRVSARPDVAYLNVGAQAMADTAAEAQAMVSGWINQALRELEALGATSRDIETVQVSVSPQWDYQGEKPEIKGYRAIHDLRVKVRDLDQVGPWLDAMLAAGMNRVNGVHFGVEQDELYQDEALRLAVQDARRRAQVAAQAAGVELGPVLKVEIDGSARAPVMMERVAMAAMAADTQVMPGDIQFQANVRIVFGL